MHKVIFAAIGIVGGLGLLTTIGIAEAYRAISPMVVYAGTTVGFVTLILGSAYLGYLDTTGQL